jgi:hypothetical protein
MTDPALLLGDKFNRLGNQTMIEVKKGNLVPYNLVIESTKGDQGTTESRTHYWSNVLLTSNAEEVLEDLGDYLTSEEILDQIVENWELGGTEKGPAWSLAQK